MAMDKPRLAKEKMQKGTPHPGGAGGGFLFAFFKLFGEWQISRKITNPGMYPFISTPL